MRMSIIAIALLTLTGCQAEDAAQLAEASCAFDGMALDGASFAERTAIKHVFYQINHWTSLALYEDGAARWQTQDDGGLDPLMEGTWSITDDCTLILATDTTIEVELSNPEIDSDGRLLYVDIDEPNFPRSGASLEVMTDFTPSQW
jgi:hypothetical protein